MFAFRQHKTLYSRSDVRRRAPSAALSRLWDLFEVARQNLRARSSVLVVRVPRLNETKKRRYANGGVG